MLERLKWNGPVEFQGKTYDSFEQAEQVLRGVTGDVCIVFKAPKKPRDTIRDNSRERMLRITVCRYMTRPSTPNFTFHDRRNQGVPMPERTMEGTVIDETAGMFKMRLRGTEDRDVSWEGWVIKSAILSKETL